LPPCVAQVSSSGEARKQLKLFDAYEKECASMVSDTFAELKDVGAELVAEKCVAQLPPHPPCCAPFCACLRPPAPPPTHAHDGRRK